MEYLELLLKTFIILVISFPIGVAIRAWALYLCRFVNLFAKDHC